MGHEHLGDFDDLSLSVVVTSPPWYENCYIVRHRPTGAVAVVDPGGDAERILAAVASEDGQAQTILLTHGHPDHLGAARAVEAALAVDTRAHADEMPVIKAAGELNRAFGGGGLEGPGRLATFTGEPTLDLGGVPIRVIHTPGHTPGGVCYDFGRFVLTGDTLFRHGVGRTDLAGGSEQQLWASIARMLGMVAEDAVLYSGHGPEWVAKDARRWWQMVG